MADRHEAKTYAGIPGQINTLWEWQSIATREV